MALKSRPVILKIDPSDGLPKCFGTQTDDKGKEHECILQSMFVQTKENWVGLPTVHYIDLKGIRCSDGQESTERIKQ